MKHKKRRREDQRKSVLKHRYGMSVEDYDALLKEQNSGCAICGNPIPGRNNKHFAIDHNHKTNKVRGLLCYKCNSGIGYFKENIDFLQKAIDYLKKHD